MGWVQATVAFALGKALMSSPLIIHAGRAVRERILRDGFRYDDFDVVLGAAGGPKWLVLYGLDAVLAPALAAAPRPRTFIGASVGAWRLAAYLQADPQGALDRLLARYRDPAFFAEARPDMTARFEADVSAVLGQAGLDSLAQGVPNALFAVVTAFGPGRWNLPWRLALTALGNALRPRSFAEAGALGLGQRVLAGPAPAPPWLRAALPGTDLTLRPEQWPAALLATAAVPGLIRPVEGLLPRGALGIDGGIADYHFGAIPRHDGFTLYPHFYPHLVPGWFDKPFTRRRLDPTSVDHVLLMAPSPAFVAGLPGGKIPDRKDPQTLGGAALGERWGQVAEASRALGDAWAALTEGEGLGLARALAS